MFRFGTGDMEEFRQTFEGMVWFLTLNFTLITSLQSIAAIYTKFV